MVDIYSNPIVTRTPIKHFIEGWKQKDAESLKSLNPVKLGSGLPNVVREQLARENRASFSLLMDCAIRYGFELTALTIEEIASQCSLSIHTIRKAVDDPMIRVTYRNNKKVGRPEKVYYIPDRERVRLRVTPGNNGMSDHLPEWGLTSVSNYRKARYYMLIARGCNYVASSSVTYAREFICKIIGVVKSTLIKYEDELDMLVIHNIQQTQMNRESARMMPARMDGAYLKIENNGIVDHVPAIRGLIYRALDAGATVTLFQYLPNTYSIRNWDKFRALT